MQCSSGLGAAVRRPLSVSRVVVETESLVVFVPCTELDREQFSSVSAETTLAYFGAFERSVSGEKAVPRSNLFL